MGKRSVNTVHASGGFAHLIRTIPENEITILDQRLRTINTLVVTAVVYWAFGACMVRTAYPKKQEAAGKPPLYTIK